MFSAWAAEVAGTAGETGSGHWQLALIFAAIVLLWFFARWRKARLPALPTTRQLRERDTEPNRYREASDKALVELLETSRELNARVDSKIRILNRLVKDARDSAAKLEALLAEARAPRGTGIPSQDGNAAPPPEFSAPAAAPAPPPERAGESKRVFLSELHERVHRLRREGRSSAEIAKATSLSTTEVEFIITTLG